MPMQPTLSTGGRLLAKIGPDEKYDLNEYPKDNTPPIIKLLKLHINSKKSVIELLCLDNGYRHDSKMHLVVFDMAGRVKTIGEMLESEYGIRRDTCKCTECGSAIQTDICLAHLENNYQSGHQVGIKSVIKFLASIAY